MNFFNLFDKAQTPTPPVVAPHAHTDDAIESRIDRICRAVGVDPTQIEARAGDASPVPPQIWDELRAGRKIQAIKEYRDWTGCGLKEAKDAIDAMDAGQMPQGTPRQAILEAKLDAVLSKLELGR
jgi:hypothetical protein